MWTKKAVTGLVAVAAGLLVSTAQAALLVELKALPGSGYSVLPDNKTVIPSGTGPVNINLQLVATVGTNATNDVLLLTQGNLVTQTRAGSSAAVTGGGLQLAIAPAFQNGAFSAGLGQNLNSTSPVAFDADSVTDIGRTGSATSTADANTFFWTSVGGATADWAGSGARLRYVDASAHQAAVSNPSSGRES